MFIPSSPARSPRDSEARCARGERCSTQRQSMMRLSLTRCLKPLVRGEASAPQGWVGAPAIPLPDTRVVRLGEPLSYFEVFWREPRPAVQDSLPICACRNDRKQRFNWQPAAGQHGSPPP